MSEPRARSFTENAGDPEDVKGAGAQARRIERRRLGYYATVLATEAGRAVMWDLLCQAGLFESSFSQSSLIYFNEGRRNVGLKLRADLELADESLVEQMEREARARRRADANETDARHTASADSVGAKS
jgi:hypothetical protein